MPVERTTGGSSLIDVLDRVLDKGIVIDAWVRVSLVGIDLITVEARVVVASIDTYLKYSEAVGSVSSVSKPALSASDGRATEAVLAENASLRAQLAAASRNGARRRRGVQPQDDITNAARPDHGSPSGRPSPRFPRRRSSRAAGGPAGGRYRGPVRSAHARVAAATRGAAVGCVPGRARGDGPAPGPGGQRRGAVRADRGLQRRSRAQRAPLDSGAAGRRTHDDRSQRQPCARHPAGPPRRPGHRAGAAASARPARRPAPGLTADSRAPPAGALAGPRRWGHGWPRSSRRCGSRSPSADCSASGACCRASSTRSPIRSC